MAENWPLLGKLHWQAVCICLLPKFDHTHLYLIFAKLEFCC